MKTVATLALLAVLTGCGVVDSMKEGFTHSQEVAADLEKSVGSKPFVGFNWSNGVLTNISVTFDGIPAGKSTPEIAALARSSIASHFRQEPRQLVIGFTLAGSAQ